MTKIKECTLPKSALLNRYNSAIESSDRLNIGNHTDCFSVDVPFSVSFEEFATAFYTGRLFRLERFILKWLAAKPSSDQELNQLLVGKTNAFAAWTLEDRCENQILLCDYLEKTRSWLMIEIRQVENISHTRLYFGSAVVKENNNRPFGIVFKLLSVFHKWYSVALLTAAKNTLSGGRK